MNGASRWSRILVIVGLVAMVIGVLDPLEGSLVILLGTALVALGALLGKSRHRIFLYWSFALVAVGVGAMWWLSALGGFGGNSGRSNWWGHRKNMPSIDWVIASISFCLPIIDQE